MHDCDFEYAGHCLSDFGFIVCDFNAPSGADIVSAGATITFHKSKKHSGRKYGLVAATYDECLTATFDICKNPALYDDALITNDEYRDIVRWLNRREFLPFRVIPCIKNADACYFNASFNISKIEVGRELYGLQLTMETDSPFGYGTEIIESFDATSASQQFEIYDMSDEVGRTYLDMQITCRSSGDLSIINHTAGCEMVIRGCTSGEVITIHGESHIIESSNASHAVYDDFNYNFMYLLNSYEERSNMLSATIPCSVEARYRPVIKGIP